MRHKSSTADERIAKLAGGAHGVVTREELLAAGVTLAEIRARLDRGSLIRIPAGVYRVGHAAPSIEATYMAAVKAGGGEAVLSGEAAAHLLGVKRGAPPQAEISVATQRHIKGVRTRRRDLPKTERTTYNRIPCTTAARTVVDLAATLEPSPLSRVVHEATIRHDLKPDQVAAILNRQPNTPGARTLRQIVSGDAATVLSELEKAFIKVL